MTKFQRALAVVGGLTVIPLSAALVFHAGDRRAEPSVQAVRPGPERARPDVRVELQRPTEPSPVASPALRGPGVSTGAPARRPNPGGMRDSDYAAVDETADPPGHVPGPGDIERLASPDLSMMARAKPASENAPR